MLSIADWADEKEQRVGSHTLRLLTVDEDKIAIGRQNAVVVLPGHYVSEQRLSRAFFKLGRKAVSRLLSEKLPHNKKIRSGDLGEVFATEYIDERTEYHVAIKRLRWKDSRDMSMRGDDIIGINADGVGTRLRFLKAESKSRTSLNNHTVTEARESLDLDGGLPSAHSLTFIAERLYELGEEALADAITHTQLKVGIRHSQVKHLMFAFTGNAPDSYLELGLNLYTGPVSQIAVGLWIVRHQDFIESVFNDALSAYES